MNLTQVSQDKQLQFEDYTRTLLHDSRVFYLFMHINQLYQREINLFK